MSSTKSGLALAIQLYKAGKYQHALNRVQESLQAHPHDGRLWELCGMTLECLGDNAGAINALEAATMLVPLSAAGQVVLAKCYAKDDKCDLAIEILQHLMSLDDLPARLFPVIASQLGRLGKPAMAMAMEACRRAASHEVDDGQPLYGMAHYMEKLQYPTEMIASVLRQAIAVEPNRFQYRYSLSNAYRKLGQHEQAYEILRGIVDRDVLKGISCVQCIRCMHTLFSSHGDESLARLCADRLSEFNAA